MSISVSQDDVLFHLQRKDIPFTVTEGGKNRENVETNKEIRQCRLFS